MPTAPIVSVLPGSSPLTRGKLSATRLMVPVTAAHPRSRGENIIADPIGAVAKGSSPLTRGKLLTSEE